MKIMLALRKKESVLGLLFLKMEWLTFYIIKILNMENSKRKIKKGVKYLSLMPIYNASKQRMLLRENRNEAYGQSRNVHK